MTHWRKSRKTIIPMFAANKRPESMSGFRLERKMIAPIWVLLFLENSFCAVNSKIFPQARKSPSRKSGVLTGTASCFWPLREEAAKQLLADSTQNNSTCIYAEPVAPTVLTYGDAPRISRESDCAHTAVMTRQTRVECGERPCAPQGHIPLDWQSHPFVAIVKLLS